MIRDNITYTMITSWGKTGKENVNGIENWKQNSRVAKSEMNDTRAIGIGFGNFGTSR